jgi:probable phosphoglycerate mutase
MKLEKLYFIRHGETDLNLQHRCQGRQDISLNATGREQMKRTAEKMAGVRLDAIYSSPLKRAVESAEIVAKPRGMKTAAQDWLNEIDHGALEGLNREEADAAHPGLMRVWLEKPDEAVFPGGETLSDVERRALEGLRGLLRTAEGSVALVTHQVISGVARCAFLGLPLSATWEDKLVNGDWFEFALDTEIKKRILSRGRPGF